MPKASKLFATVSRIARNTVMAVPEKMAIMMAI
jgi:hypothetical protein